MAHGIHVKSVAVVGAGAAGTITASALAAEKCFDRIQVFERRESAGGTWQGSNSKYSLLSLNTTVEDVAVIGGSGKGRERWRLTLRKHDFARDIDEPLLFKNKKVLAIGNSASGHDLTAELATAVKQPVYQSRRSKSRWDGDEPPAGHAWKPTIKEFLPPGRIIFEDNPFEYQAIAIARLFAGTQARDLPILEEQEKWEQEREKGVHTQQIKFHDVEWGTGETLGWFGELYQIAGLRQLTGEGRNLPVTGEDVRWAIEHLRKYSEPEPRRHLTVGGSEDQGTKVMTPDALVRLRNEGKSEWVVVKTRPRVPKKDPLAFI
ncbi:unnamed protein product [Diplocarpon coronariae]